MSAKTLLRELKSLGSQTGASTYRRHGAEGEVWGVRYADFDKLKKRIGPDLELADALWGSGVHDAQILALMVADPAKVSAATLDRWAKGATDHMTSYQLGALTAQTPKARQRAEKWMKAKKDLQAATGWNAVAGLANREDLAADADAWFAELLQVIRDGIEAAGNRTRYSMNTALIAIGCRNPKLQKQAIAVARAIGKVEVDHGDTSCKTPDAEPYILKTVKHRAEVAARRAKKKAVKRKATKKKVAKHKKA